MVGEVTTIPLQTPSVILELRSWYLREACSPDRHVSTLLAVAGGRKG